MSAEQTTEVATETPAAAAPAPESNGVATPAAGKAPGKKAVKKAPAKKVVKTVKAVKKATKKAAGKKKEVVHRTGPSIRENVFRLLSKSNVGLTGAQIQEKLELGGVPALLKDEGVCDQPRIRRKMVEGVRGVVYELTARGRKDLEAGKVDENAAPKAAGKDWK